MSDPKKCWFCGKTPARKYPPYRDPACNECAASMVKVGYKLKESAEIKRQTVRQACRDRKPLSGVDAEALEGALQHVERECAALREQLAAAEAYAERLAAGLPDGMLPKDVEAMRDANAAMATQIVVARAAEHVLDAVSIAAHLSRDMKDGESLVAWVKRVLGERECRPAEAGADRECGGETPTVRRSDHGTLRKPIQQQPRLGAV